jgi:2-oxoisovalerate dehydrogenase E1 component
MSRAEPATGAVNWPRVLEIVQRSRALDELEETRLVPERKVLYQFTARGHDVTQALRPVDDRSPTAAAITARVR